MLKENRNTPLRPASQELCQVSSCDIYSPCGLRYISPRFFNLSIITCKKNLLRGILALNTLTKKLHVQHEMCFNFI